jgi:hypothetical protein
MDFLRHVELNTSVPKALTAERASNEFDFGGPWTLSTTARLDLIRDCLAFLEAVEGSTHHGRMVEKQLVPLALDKAKASIGYQLLDCALRHSIDSFEQNNVYAPQRTLTQRTLTQLTSHTLSTSTVIPTRFRVAGAGHVRK